MKKPVTSKGASVEMKSVIWLVRVWMESQTDLVGMRCWILCQAWRQGCRYVIRFYTLSCQQECLLCSEAELTVVKEAELSVLCSSEA